MNTESAAVSVMKLDLLLFCFSFCFHALVEFINFLLIVMSITSVGTVWLSNNVDTRERKTKKRQKRD